MTISIPIFSNRQYKTAYNKAKYAITTSQLELLNAQKQLLQTVEGIYLDATSSQTQYTSATERLSYVKESYNLIDEQFSLGMKNTLELLTEKNNYLTAQQEQLQAKYMALMSVQLLNVIRRSRLRRIINPLMDIFTPLSFFKVTLRRSRGGLLNKNTT